MDEIEALSKSRREVHLQMIADDVDGKLEDIGASDPPIFPDVPRGYDDWKPKLEQRVRGKYKKMANIASLSPRTFISNAILVQYGPHFSEFLNQGQYEWAPVNHGVSDNIQHFVPKSN